jgi:DNA-directed RNA polymerase specialized sigma24 family protein
VNLARFWFRRKMAERRALARLGTDPAEHHAPDLADVVTIRQKVAALPQRQRTPLVLRYYAYLPYRAGCRPHGVHTWHRQVLTNKAMRSLRSELPVHLAEEVPDAS